MWQAIERLMPREGRVERSMGSVFRKYDPLISAWEKQPGSEELSKLLKDANEELAPLAHERDLIETERWRRRAYRYRVPLPSNKTECWANDSEFLSNTLTVAGINELRKAIYEEQKRRRESLQSWAGVLAQLALGATGVIGALTALFSVLHHGAGK